MRTLFNDIRRFKEKYRNEVIVIKFGGALAEDPAVVQEIIEQAAFLTTMINAHVILVHGGGRQIDTALTEAGIPIRKDETTGLRITDARTLDVTDRILRQMNDGIVATIHQISGDVRGVGFAGYSNRLVQARPIDGLERTGSPFHVDADFLRIQIGANHDRIPVVYPICFNAESKGDQLPFLNVNADDVAVAIAVALGARRLILASDIPGVLNQEGQILTGLTERDCEALIADGTVTGGMIPKLRGAAEAAVKLKTGGVVILDGRQENAILRELLYTEGAGTLIRSYERTRALGLGPET